VPQDLWHAEVPEPLNYKPVVRTRMAPDPAAVSAAAKAILKAKRPVIYAGQGIHWAKAWKQLRALAELLAIPVVTSLEGKSAFPETHPLSLGSGGVAVPKPVRYFLDHSDVIFGIGCSFTETSFGVAMPKGKFMIHSTLDEAHLNKDIYADIAVLGDAALVLDALLEEIKAKVKAKRDAKNVTKEMADMRKAWLKEWEPRLTSDETPLSPYRVLHDLHNTVDVRNTIITHDAGSPRDQLSRYSSIARPMYKPFRSSSCSSRGMPSTISWSTWSAGLPAICSITFSCALVTTTGIPIGRQPCDTTVCTSIGTLSEIPTKP